MTRFYLFSIAIEIIHCEVDAVKAIRKAGG